MKDLNQQDKVRVAAALNVLEREGPALGRPLVDGIRGSRHPRMKELRVGTLRLLFDFDPARVAIVLVGGDKRDAWSRWYPAAIARADDLYDEWLDRRQA